MDKDFILHISKHDPLELLLEYAMCGLTHNNRKPFYAKQWYNQVKQSTMTPERLAEILEEIDLRYLSQEYSSSNLAAELLKVCRIEEVINDKE